MALVAEQVLVLLVALVLVPPLDVTDKGVGGNRLSLDQDTQSGASGLMALYLARGKAERWFRPTDLWVSPTR